MLGALVTLLQVRLDSQAAVCTSIAKTASRIKQKNGDVWGQARHSRHAAGDIEALVGHREERSNPMAEPHALEGSKSSADPAGPNQGCRRIGNSRGIRVRISEPM